MNFLLSRVLSIVITLIVISVVTFTVVNILPGDVAMMVLGTQSNPAALAGLRQTLGLNDPLWLQYLHWMGGLLSLHLG
ncbi:MAG: ABC transporter permease, partial [Janthinobacterium lividum]